jgi:O-antigen/teichoic acid export membrane protein
MQNKIVKNSLFNMLGFILSAIVAFLLTPFIVHSLGKTHYGIWSFMVSLTGYFGLLDFGMRTAIVKYSSGYHAAGNYAEMNSMNRSTQTLYAIIGSFSWVGAVGISFFLGTLFETEVASGINYTVIMTVIGADIFLTFFFMIYQGNIAGLQRYDVIFVNSSLTLLIRAGLTWFFLSRGYGIAALVGVGLGGNLVGYLLNFQACRVLCKGLTFGIGKLDRKQLAKVWNYSLKSFIINVSDKVTYYSDSIIIGIMLNAESVTVYTIAASLIAYLRSTILAVCGGYIPAISEAHARGDILGVQTIVLNGTRLIMFVLVPIVTGLVLLGDDFIRLWMGSGFEKTYQVLIILSLSQFLVLAQHGVAMALYGVSRHGLLARIYLFVTFVNIVLAVGLGRMWGILGVAVGSGVAMGILQLFLKSMLKEIQLEVKTLLSRGVLPFLKVGVLFSAFVLFCRLVYPPTTWMKFAANLIVVICIYLPACYAIALNRGEKDRVCDVLGQWRRRIVDLVK